MTIPAEYRAGYERARQVDPVLTERYLRHTTVGDPAADALIEALNRQPREHAHRWIEGGIEGKADALRDAPDGVRDFFAALEPVPDWWNA
ncbi:MAG TPA: hypothetical protein VEA63_07330, partial [Opitutus sp.]|nr:hypothetical protein [Opitutus sp.]